ncbi:MAG: alanine racemase [Rikenellaceae bacterium]
MNYTTTQIANITGGKLFGNSDTSLESVAIDSRTIGLNGSTLFVALWGGTRSGSSFIQSAHSSGVRAFMVNHLPENWSELGDFIVVNDTLDALQELAKYHRRHFSGEVVAITGSNGKTIVKEWFAQLWDNSNGELMRSPRSYNSQIGVALSLLMIKGDERVAVIEVGISKVGEMARLKEIVEPTLAVITNIGDAHSENFKDNAQKLSEKLLLLQDVERTVRGDMVSHSTIEEHNMWCVEQIYRKLNISYLREKELLPLALRLEVQQGVLNSVIINDSYSNDITSLQAALDFTVRQALGRPLVLILSDMEQVSTLDNPYQSVKKLLENYCIQRLYTIGEQSIQLGGEHYNTTEALLEGINISELRGSVVLIKGARSYGAQRISARLEERTHTTAMEVNLGQIIENFRSLKARCAPHVEFTAMVKANAYGLGAVDVSRALVEAGVSRLAVAFTDEGVELRRAGINTPIIVLNSDSGCYAAMIENNLEPEIFSIESLRLYSTEVHKAGAIRARVHLKIDSGMHRLGFMQEDVDKLCQVLTNTGNIEVATIFTHLSSADDPSEDDFTRSQITLFKKLSSRIIDSLGYDVKLSIANSAGTVRFSEAHQDIVRLGIGLYENSVTLRTKISQIKEIKAAQSIGYNRREIAQRDMKIAMLPIGYADGLSRALSCRVGSVSVGGVMCDIVGSVSMDITIVDITGLDVAVGDSVIVMGSGALSVGEVAGRCSTISYEVLCGIARRIKRLYYF